MYNFKSIVIDTEEELLKFFSEEEIMLYYFGYFKPRKHYPCPFKPETDPSFYISYYRGRLKWRRFGLYESPRSPVEFVKLLFPLLNHIQIINKIYWDLQEGVDQKIVLEIREASQDEIDMAVEIDHILLDFEKQYFKDYHVTESTLKYYEIKGCRDSFIANKRFCKSRKSDPAFVYLHDKDSYSIYRPLAEKSKKHRKHNIRNHIMGYKELPETGDILFITKSMKDIMVFHELGIPAIAPHSERTFLPKGVLDELKLRFKEIYVVYDNDETGVEASKKFTKENDLKYWNVPNNIDCKDPAEVSKKFGLEILKQMLNDKGIYF